MNVLISSMNWLVKRLEERSTWVGMIWLSTAFGIKLKPELWEYVIAIGMALAGVIDVVVPDPQPIQKDHETEQKTTTVSSDSIHHDDLLGCDVGRFPDGMHESMPSSHRSEMPSPTDSTLRSGFGDRN